jgi:asparagine synthase (glutamine-hydrolysing)
MSSFVQYFFGRHKTISCYLSGMCGIAGLVSSVGADDCDAIARDMASTLRHRGPDGAGTYISQAGAGRHIALAHTLLSIIGGAEAGKQPFHVPGGVLVFNGAIYNFKNLRESLKAQGCVFRTETDTEVLAYGLATHGVDFLSQTRGMFAFGFWDQKRGKLLLGRDPLGVKPLYYFHRNEHLFFASEYKAFLPYIKNPEIDREAVHDYLRFRYVPGERTLIRQIRKLPQASVGVFDPARGTFEIQTYWSLEKHVEKASPPRDPAELFQTIETAISRRAVADVEVAALLSGGIDSGLVCDILEKSIHSLHTYTLDVGDPELSEAKKASEISHRIGSENTIIPNSKPGLQDLSELVYHLDDPYGDPIILALQRIFRSIHGKQRVVVTGEGADELFSGYVHQRMMGMLDQLSKMIPGWNILSGLSLKVLPANLIRKALPYSGKLTTEDLKRALDRFSAVVSDSTLQGFQSFFYLFDDRLLVDPKPALQGTSRGYKRDLKSVREWDLRYWLADSQLFKLDKISMASSIEAREPFVDIDLVSQVYSIPAKKHFSWNTDKPKLRAAALGRTRIGDEVVKGKKSSFFQPFSRELIGSLPNEIADFLKTKKSFLSQFLQEEALSEATDPNGNGLLSQKRLFALGALGLWEDRIWKLQHKQTHVKV